MKLSSIRTARSNRVQDFFVREQSEPWTSSHLLAKSSKARRPRRLEGLWLPDGHLLYV